MNAQAEYGRMPQSAGLRAGNAVLLDQPSCLTQISEAERI